MTNCKLAIHDLLSRTLLTMHIEVVDFVAGAQSARGIAVVIDVFRAFSVAAYAFARGAALNIPVAEVATARQLKRENPNAILLGERYAKPLPGFDCGNSPTELEQLDVRGRTLIHTTHSGTQGLASATNADEVITGALVNCGAVVRYLKSLRPKRVTLVRMGQEARERCDEDDLCAELIAARLHGGELDTSSIRERLRGAKSAQKFFDPACDWAPERDFELCTEVDIHNFVLRLDRGESPAMLRRVDV
ncbi:MAG TPA: 2-phosphosulfolactate phosphatase [Steroidobacteraceae bacterium]|nr:2-phosphosulfolactate phosphatase [Steroidobacteraceae bacterium]